MFRSSSASILVVGTVLMMMLVRAATGDEEPQARPQHTTPDPKPRRLDLRPPDITKLYSPEEIDWLLAASLRHDIEEVEVEGAREGLPPNTPKVWGAIAAPFWAILHPTQAWRIFAPLPPDQSRGMENDKPDATSTLRKPVVPAIP